MFFSRYVLEAALGFAHPKHLLDEDEIAKLKEQNQRGVSSESWPIPGEAQ